MDATPEEAVDGSVKTRKQIYVPKTIEIPAMVKPVFDDSYLEVTDTQQWDENTPYEIRYSITPGVLAEYITMNGVLQMRPSSTKGAEGCRQVITGTCTVDIPFVGWYVEQAIISNMQTFYEGYPEHIDAFVNMLVTTFGDGTRASMNDAFERMLKEPALKETVLNGTAAMPNGVAKPQPAVVGDTSDKEAAAESKENAKQVATESESEKQTANGYKED